MIVSGICRKDIWRMVLRKIMPFEHPRDTVSMSSVHSEVSGITSHNSMCIVCVTVQCACDYVLWMCVHVCVWCMCIFFIQPQTLWFQCSENKLWLKMVNKISRCITSGVPKFGGGVLHLPSDVTCLHGRLPHLNSRTQVSQSHHY